MCYVLLSRWPDTWIGRESDGSPWKGKRYVRAAGLKNITQHHKNTSLASTKSDESLRRMRRGISQFEDFSIPIMSSVEESAKASGNWTVDLAMGFPWSIRSAVNYSGSVVLHFTDTLESGVVYAIGHPSFQAIDQDERDAIARNKKKEDKFNERKHEARMKYFIARRLFVFILLFITGFGFFCCHKLLDGLKNFWSHEMRRKVCRILARVFSKCECFRVFFTRNWYGYFKSRGGPADRNGEVEDDDDESTDRTLLSLNTRHNSITTLNGITTHISLPNIERSGSSGRVRILKNSSSAGDESLLQLGEICTTKEIEIFPNRKESEDDGDSNFCDVDCDSTIGKSLSGGSILSSSSTGTLVRKKYITWGAFTHLNAPLFYSRSNSESSSLHSKSTSSSDGGYGSINSLNSLDS